MPVPCPNCGSYLDEGSTACPQCDPQAAPATPPIPVPPAPPLFSSFEQLDTPRGIGGWLILVALGLVLGPFIQLVAIWTNFHAFIGPNRALAERVIPGLSALVMFQLVTGCVLFLANLFLLVLFFREKRSFPRYAQIWLGFSAVVYLAAYTLCPHHPAAGVTNEAISGIVDKMQSQLIRASMVSVLRAAIWIAYLGLSRRVKATFVH